MHSTKPLTKKQLLAYLDKQSKKREQDYAAGRKPDLTLKVKKSFTFSR
jgi:hypothetical protein